MLKCMFLLYEYLVRGKVLIWADRNRNYIVSFTVFKNNRYPSVEHISYFLFFGATLKKKSFQKAFPLLFVVGGTLDWEGVEAMITRFVRLILEGKKVNLIYCNTMNE